MKYCLKQNNVFPQFTEFEFSPSVFLPDFVAKRECGKIKAKVNELKLEMVYSNFLLL